MLISHICKFIYLKTRKTGGTSVEIYFEPFCVDPTKYTGERHHRDAEISAWGVVGSRGTADGPWYNHMPAHEVRARAGQELWDAYYKFCVVRNPFDKVVSWFWHEMAPEQRAALQQARFSGVRQCFEDWTELRRFPVDSWIYRIDGVPAADSFLRYERLRDDMGRVCGTLRIPWQPERFGRYKSDLRRRPEPFHEYYTARSAELVEQAFAWEFEYFGYPGLGGYQTPRLRNSM
jgi:hypothetical protein